MQEKIQEQITKETENFLHDLKTILQIPSVEGPPTKNAPFGEEPKRALETVLALAKSFGLQTKNIHHAIGYAQLGEGEDYIGVIGHLDVVRAGENWLYPPFDLSEEKGFLYGRGILDNKGPILSCLYALKILKALNLPLKQPIRIIFGTNEESGCRDVPYYLAEEKAPRFAFTPDCKFPVVYGEQGILGIKIKTPLPGKERTGISKKPDDMASDHIPDWMSVLIDQVEYTVKGKRAPTNAPEFAENAITKFAHSFHDFEGKPSLSEYFKWLSDTFHEKIYGEGLAVDFSDKTYGKLTLSPYKIDIEKEGIVLYLAIRYPVCFKEEEILAELEKKLLPNSKYEVVRRLPSVLFEKDRDEIQKLSAVYKEVTGQNSEPVTTTGATYARFLPNTVAFGPSFPNQKGIAHNQNEWMKKEELLLCMKIYALSLWQLAGGKKDEHRSY